MVPTPECDKLVAVQPKSQVIGEFLDWLAESNFAVCRYANYEDAPSHDGWVPARLSLEELLAEFFVIDLGKVEQERRAILDELRGQS